MRLSFGSFGLRGNPDDEENMDAPFAGHMNQTNYDMHRSLGMTPMLSISPGKDYENQTKPFSYAAGGPVTPPAPTSIQQDTVNAKLNPDEYVIPKEAVLWKGQEFWSKQVDKARSDALGMKPSTGMTDNSADRMGSSPRPMVGGMKTYASNDDPAFAAQRRREEDALRAQQSQGASPIRSYFDAKDQALAAKGLIPAASEAVNTVGEKVYKTALGVKNKAGRVLYGNQWQDQIVPQPPSAETSIGMARRNAELGKAAAEKPRTQPSVIRGDYTDSFGTKATGMMLDPNNPNNYPEKLGKSDPNIYGPGGVNLGANPSSEAISRLGMGGGEGADRGATPSGMGTRYFIGDRDITNDVIDNELLGRLMDTVDSRRLANDRERVREGIPLTHESQMGPSYLGLQGNIARAKADALGANSQLDLIKVLQQGGNYDRLRRGQENTAWNTERNNILAGFTDKKTGAINTGRWSDARQADDVLRMIKSRVSGWRAPKDQIDSYFNSLKGAELSNEGYLTLPNGTMMHIADILEPFRPYFLGSRSASYDGYGDYTGEGE